VLNAILFLDTVGKRHTLTIFLLLIGICFIKHLYTVYDQSYLKIALKRRVSALV